VPPAATAAVAAAVVRLGARTAFTRPFLRTDINKARPARPESIP
jgi:hypothetical protein